MLILKNINIGRIGQIRLSNLIPANIVIKQMLRQEVQHAGYKFVTGFSYERQKGKRRVRAPILGQARVKGKLGSAGSLSMKLSHMNSNLKPALNKLQSQQTYLNQSTNMEADYSLWQDIGNQIRIDSARAVHVTKTGHPTSSSSIADIMAVLFFHEQGLKFHSNNPRHFRNDRIVLSKGHACPALYSAFYHSGLITENDMMSLRLKGSIIEGHPVPKIPFVDVGTGSLGQGLSVAAGMAYSSKYYDKINNRIYCITGDGQVVEGSIWEAAAFASHYKLNNLIVFCDVNAIGQSGFTMYQHDLAVYDARFKAFGFNTILIDGHSIKEIVEALRQAQAETERPTAIICKTLKGKGYIQKIEGKLNWHGKDLGGDLETCINELKSKIKHQNIEYKTFAPEGDDVVRAPINVQVTPNYNIATDKISTRKAYGNGLLKAYESDQRVVALDGDTEVSTFSITLAQKHPEAFIECFIAEQNMVGVATGLACRNKIAFCSTFAAFLSRAADQIRIAGISGSNLKMVGSHAGVNIGEDGPSQMALEDFAFFRTLPKGVVLVPSDGVSAEKAVELAANYNDGPVFIRTSRPDVPILFPNDEPFAIGKCKVIKASANDKLIIIATAVTTQEALKAWNKLNSEGISVRLLDIFSLKPLDEEGIRQNIEEVGGSVLFVEEHYPEGGIRDAVCGAVPGSIKRIEHLCVRQVPGSAKPEEQLQIHRVNDAAIYEKVKEMLA